MSTPGSPRPARLPRRPRTCLLRAGSPEAEDGAEGGGRDQLPVGEWVGVRGVPAGSPGAAQVSPRLPHLPAPWPLRRPCSGGGRLPGRDLTEGSSPFPAGKQPSHRAQVTAASEEREPGLRDPSLMLPPATGPRLGPGNVGSHSPTRWAWPALASAERLLEAAGPPRPGDPEPPLPERHSCHPHCRWRRQ